MVNERDVSGVGGDGPLVFPVQGNVYVLEMCLKPEVDRLLDIKMNAPELKLIPRVDAINSYLDESIEVIEFLLDRMGDEQHNDWDELNSLFREIIGH